MSAQTFAISLAVVVLAIAGCSSSDDKPVVSTATPTPSPATATATATTKPTEAPKPTTPPTATATPVKAAKIGDTTTSKGSKYTVNAVTDPAPATNQFSKPAEGKRWVAVDITQEGIVAGDPINPFYFSVQDAESFVYQQNGSGPTPHIASGNLSPGQKVRGWVTFEVPTAAKLISVLAQPVAVGGTIVIADLTQ